MLALALAGCGGGGGGTTSSTTTSGGTTGGTSAAATVTPPTGTPVDASTLSSTDFAALAPSGAVSGVSIASPPVVNFQITDTNGRGIKGLGFTSQSATAARPGLQNLAFTLAKLVPGTNGAPSKWVSYIVIGNPTTTAAGTPGRPTSDSIGTLVDNGDGTYKYTFYRDITKVKDDVAAASFSGNAKAADLGDLTYDPTLVHRLVIQVGGNARGTGSNTADGSNSGVTAVPMGKPMNIVFDWIPATGKVLTASDSGQREIVSTAACASCHEKFSFHGGNRQDPRFCVTCHTDQRKFNQAAATSTNNAFPALTKSSTGSYSPTTYVADGVTVGDFPVLIHKIHLGKELVKANYNYANVLFNEVTYPQPQTNCVKCHTGDSSAATKTAQGDNWKSVPTTKACGACHDGINFTTGKGLTLADKKAGLTSSTFGHVGGIQTDDSKCALCHSAAAVPVYHVTVDSTGANGRGGYPLNTATDVPTVGYASGQGPSIPLASQLNMPSGVYKINFEIKQVTVSSSTNKATVVYRVLKDGQPVTFNSSGYLIDNVDGSPGIYVVYATTQDGIAAPADWNGQKTASIKTLRDTAGAQTGPDSQGYYTATLPSALPTDAKMVTAAIGVDYNGFVQLNHPDYPKGIRLREPAFVMKVADGYTARRSIVDNAKCNNCHGQLGVAPSFHSGARNNGQGCALGGCHDANKNTGHTGSANSYGGGWSVASKNLIHSIHASSKREQAFNYEATTANPDGFKEVTYPGVLKSCETCHVAGSYDFSASANNAAIANLLWTTDAKTDMTNAGNVASIGLSPWINTSRNDGQANYSTNHLVSSPIAASCFGCHDSSLAVQHMESNGGTLVRKLSTVSNLSARPAVGAATTLQFSKTEQCMLCHATGKVADIKAMHAK